MTNAFYVVPIGGGDHVYASDILSECTDIARYFTKVEIVDMFGEVWRTVDGNCGTENSQTESVVTHNGPVRKAPARGFFQRLSSTSM